ncbi:Hypothetical protein I595_3210 [Croceitalea dokdonensis DOKDO 023]|uniref:Uncharacterized protein n=2 Tax=Croceitalea TaxID=574891 RepID=A0A0P7AWK8_9FLAO|nr:Hypothetical protein I595_3210 [Croceitalea dokdonensis DOKDO 023]
MNMPGKPQAYKIHTALFEQKVTSISDITQCAATIDEWMKFFRSGHLGFAVLPSKVTDSKADSTPKQERKAKKNGKKLTSI